MQNNNVLENKQIPQVAMDLMNDVHREELDIVNQISSAIFDNALEMIDQLCLQWLDHTKAHFDRENMMMEKYAFPAVHCHQGEHVDALQQLGDKVKSWQDNKDLDALTDYVRNIWPKWYVNHISTMDTVTSAYIKQCIDNE